MISILTELTLRGSLIFITTGLLDRLLAGRMQARSRRTWWWLVAFGFLLPLPLRLPLLPALPGPVGSIASGTLVTAESPESVRSPSSFTHFAQPFINLLPWLWLAGVSVAAGLVVFQTFRVSRGWTSKRLCTDPAILDILEDCKATARVTAPIGLVLSDEAASPALLGWLRPRILLPAGLTLRLSQTQLRAVLLHELAHFRALDVPLHWLFTMARALHWFNPLVHLAARRWLHQRELAADEAALHWLSPQQRPDYSEALVQALKHANTLTVPFGALALGESIENLKQRMIMITRHTSLSRLGFPAALFSLVLVALLFLQPIHADTDADAKSAAAAARQTWLAEIDAGHYETSWKTASTIFQESITSEKWRGALESVRTPLGKCHERKLVSSLVMTSIPTPKGPIKGEMVVALYDSSYENLQAARDTVSFCKEADGSWKAAGYFIAPR